MHEGFSCEQRDQPGWRLNQLEGTRPGAGWAAVNVLFTAWSRWRHLVQDGTYVSESVSLVSARLENIASLDGCHPLRTAHVCGRPGSRGGTSADAGIGPERSGDANRNQDLHPLVHLRCIAE